jgi:hypothetical protein
MCGPSRGVATLRDRWRSPARLAQRRPGAIDAGDGTRGQCGQPAEGYWEGAPSASGMGPAVVLGQDLTEATGPVRHGALADLATGDRQLGNGHREAAGRDLLICLNDASPAGVILP